MGLDMYLTAERYLSTHNSDDKELAEQITQVLDTRRRVKSLNIEAGYWRKANAIHSWFVDNAQEGQDDCRSYYVSRPDLEKLRDLCREIYNLKDTKRAERELPPQAGFFFGSVEIDESYWHDVGLTDEQLTAALADPLLQNCDFYYQASW